MRRIAGLLYPLVPWCATLGLTVFAPKLLPIVSVHAVASTPSLKAAPRSTSPFLPESILPIR